MLTIIHGDDIETSRKKLIELTENQKEAEIIKFEGSKLTLEEFLPAVESRSIFSLNKIIAIEQFLSGKRNKEKDTLENLILNQPKDVNLIIWEAKELDKTTLSRFKTARIYGFPLPKLLWRFLDSLGVVTGYEILTMFDNLTKTQDANFVFAMVVRQWHNLLLAVNLKNGNTGGLAPWQLAKLKRQASSFTESRLLNNYRKLISIDFRIKSGQTPLNLKELLDIFLINL